MLTFLIALIYSRWFFLAAKARPGANAKLWAATAVIIFFVTTYAFSWLVYAGYHGGYGVPQMHVSMALKITTPVTSLLMSYIVGSTCILAVWNFFLRPSSGPWTLARAEQQAAAVRSLAMPGRFPWFFLIVYLALEIGALMTSSSLGFHDYPPSMEALLPGKFILDFVCLAIEAAALSFVLWKSRTWFAIAAGWAGIVVALTLVNHVYFVSGSGIDMGSPLMRLVVQFGGLFVVIGILALVVQQRGAGIKTLLLASVTPRLALTFFSFALNGNIIKTGVYFMLVLLGQTALWGALVAVALYVGLLVHSSQNPLQA